MQPQDAIHVLAHAEATQIQTQSLIGQWQMHTMLGSVPYYDTLIRIYIYTIMKVQAKIAKCS